MESTRVDKQMPCLSHTYGCNSVRNYCSHQFHFIHFIKPPLAHPESERFKILMHRNKTVRRRDISFILKHASVFMDWGKCGRILFSKIQQFARNLNFCAHCSNSRNSSFQNWNKDPISREFKAIFDRYHPKPRQGKQFCPSDLVNLFYTRNGRNKRKYIK